MSQVRNLTNMPFIGYVWLSIGYVFLFIPIVTLVVYSFNDSNLSALWGGWTLKWYSALMNDEVLLQSFWLSLRLAFLTAISSVALGTLASFVLVRFRAFPGKTLFVGMINAPLVMPEVIIGLSLLLLLVTVQRLTGFPERGLMTIWLGHTLLGMAFATVIISSRLRSLDRRLEEAAMDLGCRPLQVFFLVTLPMIAQSLISAGLLAFTISLDDVVISSFLSGPGSTTMPIVIMGRARLGINPVVNVVAALTVLVVSIVAVSISIQMLRSERRRAREEAEAYRRGAVDAKLDDHLLSSPS